MSQDGYVSITGCKKDLIITSTGKTIAPQNIETGLRDTRWISFFFSSRRRHTRLQGVLSSDVCSSDLPMLADPTGALSRAFGVYIDAEGLAYRGSFVVNPEGKIKVAEYHDNGIGRNAEELVRKIQAAQFVATHDGEVCPAKWTPGAATLKPGLDLVGKI